MILLYHKVAPETPSAWWVSADAFDRQMADLQAYEVVTLDDYDPGNPRHAVITFDGVYENVYRYAFPILRKWGYPFELFVIGAHVGGDNAFDAGEPPARFATIGQLREMAEHGARVQWHSMNHARMDGLAPEALAAELDVPAPLAQAFGAPHWRWFAYPHGDHSPTVVDAVRERYAGALSCEAGNATDRHQLNRLTVLEDTRLATSTVAVIVASYNYGAYVAEAIESVLAQTRAPDEILVIDDASTDHSLEVIERYAARVRVVRNEANLGIVENFRKAVSLTRSDYVAFLGADNRMRSDYVERCKAALDAAPGVGVVYTDMLLYGPRARMLAERVHAEPVGESVIERWPVYRWTFPEPEGEALANFATVNFVHGSSMYRRAAYDQVGGYRASSGPEDHHLFKRMFDAGWGLRRAPHPLIEYRQHSATQANTALNLQLEAEHLRHVAESLRGENDRLAERARHLAAELDAMRATLQAERRAHEDERAQREVERTELAREHARERERDAEALAAARWERDHAAAMVATMRASVSWRMTAPLRFAVNFARGEWLWIGSAISRGQAAMMNRLPPPAQARVRRYARRLAAVLGLRPDSPSNAPALDAIVATRCAHTREGLASDALSATHASDPPAIDVGVVTYRSSRWIAGFVDSLLALRYPRDRLVVRFVDNDSPDDTVARLQEAIARLREAGIESHLLQRPNLGFGAGHHAAIAAGGAPWCLVTNVDLAFEPDSLARVAAIASADAPEIAAWELRQKPIEHPKFYDPVTGLTNWNSHACVLLRRSAYERVGGYDPGLFMYAEDVELSYRLRREGYELRYCPSAVVWHYTYEDAGAVKPLQYLGSTWGNLYLRLKYGTPTDVAAVVPMAVRLLAAREPFAGARAQVARRLLGLVAAAPRALASRRRAQAHFPFRTWDYDLVREGAYVEVPALPEAPPLVSVITRTYRGRAPFLRQAMLSVAHQSYPNVEHLVVEDGGDAQAAVVDEVRRATGARVRHIACAKLGRSGAGNAGLAAARGRWCVFLDDDDLLFADHVEVLVDALRAEPQAVAAYSLAWEVITDGVIEGGAAYREVSHGVPPALRQPFDAKVLAHHNFMAIQSVLFERRLYEARGGFDEDMDALEDWVLWNRYAAGERFAYVPRVTSMFRTPAHDLHARSRIDAFEKAYPIALARNEAFRARVAEQRAAAPADEALAGSHGEVA